jgi:hypothetical protein
MKKGFDFISRQEDVSDLLRSYEKQFKIMFPERFNNFIANYSLSNQSIVLEMQKDEKRGFEFPAEVILFKPSKEEKNPLYFNNFRDLYDLRDELAVLEEEIIWLEKGLVTIGFSTVGQKICLGLKDDVLDEIWLVTDDAIAEERYKFLAPDIYQFVEGFISKKN